MGTLIVFMLWLFACIAIDKILEAKKRKKHREQQAREKRVYYYRQRQMGTSKFQMKKSA